MVTMTKPRKLFQNRKKRMKVLVACEFSGIVRDAFLKRGHDVWSCDILPTERKGQHIQDDVLKHLEDGWDLMISFPPCTYLTNAGMCNLTRKNSDEKYRDNRRRLMLEAFGFVITLANAPIDKIAIENPVGYINTHWRKPDQIIHPYQFGHSVNKKTCFWLKDLPKLTPTKMVEKDKTVIWNGTGKKISKWYKDTLWQGNGDLSEVSKIRSRTFQGIANAMAKQWG